MNSKNLIGMRVGKPEVIADSGHRKNGYILRRCRCGCGNEILVPTNRLTAGVTTDCGCVPKEKRKCRAAEDLTGQKFG